MGRDGMDPRRRLALAVLCLAWFMAAADSTIVSIALPATRRKLGFSGADAQWVLNGYALAFGGLLLVCGRAGDLYGRRLLFLAGLGVFGAVSLLGGFAQSPGVLVLARFLQGAAAAGFVPAPLSLLTTIFAGGEERRNRAIGAYGTMAALGFVVGGRRRGRHRASWLEMGPVRERPGDASGASGGSSGDTGKPGSPGHRPRRRARRPHGHRGADHDDLRRI